MKRYRYTKVYIKESLIDNLNKYGDDGYRVVNIEPHTYTTYHGYNGDEAVVHKDGWDVILEKETNIRKKF